MRFKPECDHGANAGLAVARQVLEPLKAKYPGIDVNQIGLAVATHTEAPGRCVVCRYVDTRGRRRDPGDGWPGNPMASR